VKPGPDLLINSRGVGLFFVILCEAWSRSAHQQSRRGVVFRGQFTYLHREVEETN